MNAVLLSRRFVRLPLSDVRYSVKLNRLFSFFSRIHNVQLPFVYFSGHFLPEDQQPAPQIWGLHWGNHTDMSSPVKRTKISFFFVYCVVSVSLGYFSGGFWLDCGNHELHSYHHLVDVGHLRQAFLCRMYQRPKIRNYKDIFQSFYFLIFKPILNSGFPFSLWPFISLFFHCFVPFNAVLQNDHAPSEQLWPFFHIFYFAHLKGITVLWAQEHKNFQLLFRTNPFLGLWFKLQVFLILLLIL